MPETSDFDPPGQRPATRLAVYGLMLASAVAIFFAVRYFGEGLTAPALDDPTQAFAAKGGKPTSHILSHVLLVLLVVMLFGRVLGRLFVALGQPPVIGEVIAGILLGPSLLGRISPAAQAFLLPSDVVPFLGVLAQLGIVFYMFLVGLELDARLLGRRFQAAVLISHASIVVPFSLGAVLALYLYPRLATSDVPFTVFALFLGVAMSITAFPVLARILTDLKIQTTQLGVIALACAAADDVTAWCLLAFLEGVAQDQWTDTLRITGLTGLYIAAMFWVARPLLRRAMPRLESAPESKLGVVFLLAAMLLSAIVTEWIGIHGIFGAFLMGAITPHDSRLARQLRTGIEDLVNLLLLPAFFAYVGMRTQIGLVSGVDLWLCCGLIILVATVGKYGGSLAAARFSGLSWRDSSAVGLLMNTRGLMELVVLNIGLDLRVISPTMFALMVLMALATTMMTCPALALLGIRERSLEAQGPTSAAA
jgi:Kef-type K+ transport system membrane component KefB